jgi:hypothetical protein
MKQYNTSFNISFMNYERSFDLRNIFFLSSNFVFFNESISNRILTKFRRTINLDDKNKIFKYLNLDNAVEFFINNMRFFFFISRLYSFKNIFLKGKYFSRYHMRLNRDKNV